MYITLLTLHLTVEFKMFVMKIELLYFDGCPNYKRAWNDLAEVIIKYKLDASVRLLNVDTVEKANELKFAGSPTIKVNGHDLEDYEGDGIMACRVYDENNRQGFPSLELLSKRLKEAV